MEWFNVAIATLAALCGFLVVVGVMTGKLFFDTKNSKYDRFAVCLVYAAVTLAIVTELIESITVVIK